MVSTTQSQDFGRLCNDCSVDARNTDGRDDLYSSKHTLSMLRSSCDLKGRSPRIFVRSSVFTTYTHQGIAQ